MNEYCYCCGRKYTKKQLNSVKENRRREILDDLERNRTPWLPRKELPNGYAQTLLIHGSAVFDYDETPVILRGSRDAMRRERPYSHLWYKFVCRAARKFRLTVFLHDGPGSDLLNKIIKRAYQLTPEARPNMSLHFLDGEPFHIYDIDRDTRERLINGVAVINEIERNTNDLATEAKRASVAIGNKGPGSGKRRSA